MQVIKPASINLTGLKFFKVIDRKKFGKFTIIWQLNSIFVNNQWIKEEMVQDITRYFEVNENKTTTYQNFCNMEKAVPRRKFIAVTHSSTLAWRIPWIEGLGRLYCSWDNKESDTTERLTFTIKCPYTKRFKKKLLINVLTFQVKPLETNSKLNLM